jgi:hypothetical protein
MANPTRLPVAILFALALTKCLAAQSAGTTVFPTETAEPTIQYGRDIRPLLSDRCFRCHGPDQNERAADLRLDSHAFAIADRDGEAAIVPGAPYQSLLVARIKSHDEDERMPPAASNKPALNSQQVAMVERWIAQGAQYEDHWAFKIPTRPNLPDHHHPHPIDSFHAEALANNGLCANPLADSATLIRRAFLVLTGLPPTPEEMQKWTTAPGPNSYEQLVEELLTAEPYVTRHAEHLASVWLDAARYADTSGIHMDAGRQGWLWRDWLIEAIRSDKPFDEFVVEQLAGDLLPDRTQEQVVATGFLRNHVTTDEGGAINEEYLIEYAAERTATVGSVFLGLTVGCARCHDHKYDPIRQKDYYRLFSFFNNNEEPGLYSQSKNPNRALEPNVSVPTEEQEVQHAALEQQIARAEEILDDIDPSEQATYRNFISESNGVIGTHWTRPRVMSADSSGNATLTVLGDGSVLGSGENPGNDKQTYVLQTGAMDQRWLCLEALPDDSLPKGLLSRASHGNAVLQHIDVHVRPLSGDGDGPSEWLPIRFRYAVADVEQANGDFGIGNALVDNGIGWAVAGHSIPGPRTAWFLTEQPFGFAGGTELRVTLAYDSSYTQHVLGRVRFATSRTTEAGLDNLPVASSGFYTCGPFEPEDPAAIYEESFGPESATEIDRAATFKKKKWSYRANFSRDKSNALNSGRVVEYVAQRLWAPNKRTIEVALGSDDGFQLFLDGEMVSERRINRGVSLDQDRAKLELTKGSHLLVMKIVNTGGLGGFALQHLPGAEELHHDLFLCLVPDVLGDKIRGDRLLHAYRSNRSPVYLQRAEHLSALKAELGTSLKGVSKAMVMQERAMSRPTYVLTRGEYDKPDKQQPVTRQLPQMFGDLPDDLSADRLGLARWMVSDRNPLLRRVTINRLWHFVFGAGIVKTMGDFGLQGDWPSHPQLLDWLACEFRDQGHSVKSMLRLMVTSHAFRQTARVSDGYNKDPDNRLLSWFPRRRLTAEAIRDQALYVAGILVERTGGPSVKPYQPDGLWREVAMLQSNTRTFQRDDGDALWRRSLYTYWKRACPPPSLLTFDAPTREFCTITRSNTNTPLQALVLWNDEQFVEAARLLASRTIKGHATNAERLDAMYLRATGKKLQGRQRAMAAHTLSELQKRYQKDPEAAKQLAGIGVHPIDTELDESTLAAFTMLASAFLDLDATIYVD